MHGSVEFLARFYRVEWQRIGAKMSEGTRSSAFSRPKPDPRGFETTPMYQPPMTRMAPMSAIKRMPDTPVRRPINPDLTSRKLLLSSSKKAPRSGSPRVASPGSTTFNRRKRYKDAPDATSPIRLTVPPVSPLRDLTSSAVACDNSEGGDSFQYEDFYNSEDDEVDDEEDTLPVNTIPNLSPAVDELDQGNSGRVLAVTCLDNGKRYALKEHREFVSTSSRESALRELQLWDSLKHPRIIRFFRAWQDDAKLFILMRLCESGTLERFARGYLVRYGAVDSLQMRVAFRDCCSALAHMHANNCVHMDIKPANICLSRGRALLCDFDLVRRAGEIFTDVTDRTYIALEVEQGADYLVHPSADMFSLGISFLELVASIELPKNGERWNLLRTQTPNMSDYPRARDHSELFQIIQRCMSRHPGERPDAKDLLAEQCLDVPSDARLVPLEENEPIKINPYARPASATFAMSPRSLDLPRSGFEALIASPVNRSPVVSRNASRNPSPFGHQKQLDFSSNCTSPYNEGMTLDENTLSDRFTSQAVVTPRPGGTPVPGQLSRASSPRFITSSPQFFMTAALSVTVAPAEKRPSLLAPAPSAAPSHV